MIPENRGSQCEKTSKSKKECATLVTFPEIFEGLSEKPKEATGQAVNNLQSGTIVRRSVSMPPNNRLVERARSALKTKTGA